MKVSELIERLMELESPDYEVLIDNYCDTKKIYDPYSVAKVEKTNQGTVLLTI